MDIAVGLKELLDYTKSLFAKNNFDAQVAPLVKGKIENFKQAATVIGKTNDAMAATFGLKKSDFAIFGKAPNGSEYRTKTYIGNFAMGAIYSAGEYGTTLDNYVGVSLYARRDGGSASVPFASADKMKAALALAATSGTFVEGWDDQWLGLYKRWDDVWDHFNDAGGEDAWGGFSRQERGWLIDQLESMGQFAVYSAFYAAGACNNTTRGTIDMARAAIK